MPRGAGTNPGRKECLSKLDVSLYTNDIKCILVAKVVIYLPCRKHLMALFAFFNDE